jgi:hypothetical protein
MTFLAKCKLPASEGKNRDPKQMKIFLKKVEGDLRFIALRAAWFYNYGSGKTLLYLSGSVDNHGARVYWYK